MRNRIAVAMGAAGVGLVVAACSSSSSTTSSSPATSSPAAAPAATQANSPAATGQASGTATVSLAAISRIPGKALVGRDGRVLKRYPPETEPQDSGLMQDIADALEVEAAAG